MRQIKSMIAATVAVFSLTSCYSSKEAYISSWETMASSVKENHASYTDADWEKVNKDFRKLMAKEGHYKMTPAEKSAVTKAKGTVILYETKEQGTSVLGDVKDLMDMGKDVFGDILKGLGLGF